MSSTTDNNYINNPTGVRPVIVYNDGDKCCNCYEYEFPCPNHTITPLPGEEHGTMTYSEYIRTSDTTLIINELGKIPNSYQEYCELNELLHNYDLPDLVSSSDDDMPDLVPISSSDDTETHKIL